MPQLSAARTAALAAALSVLAFGLLFVAGRAARGADAPAQQAQPTSARVPVSAPAVVPLRTVAALPGLRPAAGPRPAPAVAPPPPPTTTDTQPTQSTQPETQPTVTTPPPAPVIPVPVPAPAPPRPAPKPSRPSSGGQFDDSG